MRDENAQERTSQSDSAAYFQHFRDSREPMATSPPPRLWLPGGLTLLCAALVVVGSLGPWKYVRLPTDTGLASEPVMLYGLRTDGIFSIMFATIAIVATAVILLRPSATVAAWISAGAMVLCVSVGFFDWIMFAPVDTSPSGFSDADTLAFEWGIKVVFLAGAAGTVVSFFVVRKSMRE